MDLIINILIGLIIITLLVVGLFNFIPQIEEFLEEKLNIKINIARSSVSNGVLSQIFFKYHHKDIDGWIEWMKLSDSKVKTKALETLIEHIESAPANWGGITPEVIRALSMFYYREHITIFKTTLSVAKKAWKKYKISSSCYESALKAILTINEESGIKNLEEELSKKLSSSNEEKTICIANALASCTPEANIDYLFIKILTDPNEIFKAKNHTINIIQKFSPEKSNGIFLTCIKKLIDETKEPISLDDLNIYETMLNYCTKSINSQIFDYIIQGCNNSFLINNTINVLELAIKTNKKLFSPDQLYKLLYNIKDDKDKIGNALSIAQGLSSTEKELIRYSNPLQINKFEKAPIVEININNAVAIEIPKILNDYYEQLKSALKERATKKQAGEFGGILITGFTESEKILLCRAISVEKRWSFIYGNYEDLINSGSNAKNYFDSINKNKPCLAFLDDIGKMFSQIDENFLKYIKQSINEQSVFFIGTLKEEADINEKGICSLLENNQELLSLFPRSIEINKCSDAFKMKVLLPKLSGLSNNRGGEILDKLDINKPSANLSPLEYEKFVHNYLRVSLLIYGKLIEADEYIRLTQTKEENLISV
ncbi:MAG: hypothetical protein RLZZ361_556 [Cyanobacteriota bacterium]